MELIRVNQTVSFIEKGTKDLDYLLQYMDRDTVEFSKFVSVDGKLIQAYVSDYLEHKFAFTGKIEFAAHGSTIDVYFYPSADETKRTDNRFPLLYHKDTIMHINMVQKTYVFCNACIRRYQDDMNRKEVYEPYEQYEPYELHGLFAEITDLSLSNRIHILKNRWNDQSLKTFIKIEDTWSLLFRKKKISAAVKKAKEQLMEKNQQYDISYQKRWARTQVAKEKAPVYIEKIESARSYIKTYFDQIGYKEEFSEL